jgi:hypothetical protein
MSKDALEQVIMKASNDARFRAQLSDNFDSAIRSYDLTPQEKDELRRVQISSGSSGEVSRKLAASEAASATAASASAASATANTVDANTVDANTVDANTVDANTVDANTVDANTVDAGTVDVGTVDANSMITS